MNKGARLHITGVVQGVGFRPFIYSLALRLELNGWVRNTSSGVDIEIEGDENDIDSFIELISIETPPLARIDALDIQYQKLNGFKSFEIIHSEAIQGAFQPISPDISICNDCLEELFDITDRRHRYPFINCTNCGPRFTIINDIPYDRPLTTMSPFEMCSECAEEYKDPLDRRFHAQPVACPDCGPYIWLELSPLHIHKTAQEKEYPYYKHDALIESQALLNEGKIIAIKGLGGFHLACDATNGEAVKELRNRKLRIDKPFALMFADINSINENCFVNDHEAKLLQSKERPIVILDRRPESNIAVDVAPNQNTLGVMLPYTPLHYLLFSKSETDSERYTNIQAPEKPLKILVMTSGNLSEEPIAIENNEARYRLSKLCDAFLMHNRDIRTRCDDSVVRVFQTNLLDDPTNEMIYPIRRSRGYSPFPVHLQDVTFPLLSVGGELKNIFCITQRRYAFLSHHIGDMENYETYLSFEDGINHFESLFRVRPELLAYDLHPDYLSTRYALERSESDGIPTFATQHHHAHIAACMADNGLGADEVVIGIALDGTGYGEDGNIWGGEFLLASYKSFQRIAHLEYVPLPGGDLAVRNPSRIALAYLWQYNLEWDQRLKPVSALCEDERTILRSQLDKQINTPLTSSMGRLFDAVSALAGIRQRINYEAQAAIELEMIVDPDENSSYKFDIDFSGDSLPYKINLFPIIQSIQKDVFSNTPSSIISARFHNTIAQLVYESVMAMRSRYGNYPVALSGGVWQNITLLGKTINLLQKENCKVFIHRQVPPNDGGLALGQAMISIHNNK